MKRHGPLGATPSAGVQAPTRNLGFKGYMIACQHGEGFAALADEAEAARSTEGRWPRICELPRATGADIAGCAHVF